MKKLFMIALALTFATGAFAQADLIEMLRADIKADRVAIFTASMGLTEEQSQKFWPVYRKYEYELDKIADTRIELLKNFADTYDTMTDDQAKALARQSLKLRESRLNLKKRYFEKMATAVNPRVAARFIQVEYQIQLLIDMQIAAEMPLIK